MAIIDSILISIQTAVSGASGVTGMSNALGGLTGKLLGLNAGLQIVSQVTGAVGQMMDTIGGYAEKADAAAVSARTWQIVLGRFGIDAVAAGETIAELSAKTGASEMSLKGAAASYIKMGGTLEDFSKVALAASSSWYDLTVKSITLDDAINNVATGVASGRSELLESSGVMLNASQAWARYAKEVGKTVGQLSDAEKAHAYATGVYKEEQIGIETLADKQTALSVAQNAQSQASERLAEAIGRALLPVTIQFTRVTAETTRAFTLAVNAYNEGGDAVKVLTDKYPALGRALEIMRPIFDALSRAGRDAMVGIQDAARNLEPVVAAMLPLFERVWSAIPGLIDRAGRVISETFHTINDLWENVLKPVWDSLQGPLGTAVDGIIKSLEDMLEFMDGMVTTVRALINGDWDGAWTTFSEAVSKAYTSVRESLQKIDEVYQKWEKDAIASVLLSAKNIGLNIKDGIIAGITDLSVELSEKVEAAITAMTDRLPQWVKNRMGLDGLKDAIDSVQGSAAANAQAARDRVDGRSDKPDLGGLNNWQRSVYQEAYAPRGDNLADNLVNYCARWVRDTLGDAAERMGPELKALAPQIRSQIDKLFQSNPELLTLDNGKTVKTPTARSAYANFDKAGLTREYKTWADLREGDTVFYTDGGQNHTGVYVGKGMVRGNNRVTFGATRGENPVGDVQINKLGKVSGYVSAQDILDYVRGKTPVTAQPKGTEKPPAPPTGAPPPANTDPTPFDGKFTAAQYEKARAYILAAEVAAKASKASPGDAKLAQVASDARAAMDAWVKSSEAAKAAMAAARAAGEGTRVAAKEYVASSRDFLNYGARALLLIKEQEKLAATGTAAQIENVRGRVIAFTAEGKAQAAVFGAEKAAYASRKTAASAALADDAALKGLRQEIARDAAAGREREARAGIEAIRGQQQAAIDAAKDSAAGRAKAIDAYGPQILAAEATVNQRVREQAVKAAMETANTRKAVTGANLGEIEAARRASVAEAYAAEKTANARAAADQRKASADGRASAKEETRQLAAELGGLKIDAARATSGRLQALADAEIRAAEGNAKRQLELTKASSQAAFDRAQAIAIAQRRLALDAASGKPNEAALREKAQAEYLLTLETARQARLNAVSGATANLKKETDGLSAALAQGVKDGNAALDTLDKLNLGGRDLAASARPLRDTTAVYADLLGTIVATAGELDDPKVADAWISAVEALGTRGELSAEQVAKLRSAIVDLAGVEQSLALFGLRVSDTTGDAPRYQTDDELSGKGQPGSGQNSDYLNIDSAAAQVDRFTREELATLIRDTKLARVEADQLWAAWENVYGSAGDAATGPDATAGPGKGVSREALADDAAYGTLAPGEAERLLTAMVGIDPAELGAILADLVAQGFGESDLGKLIRNKLQADENAIRDSLRDFGGLATGADGEDVYQTDDQVRGIGVAVTETTEAFIDMDEVFTNVIASSEEELRALLETAGLLPPQIEGAVIAWRDFYAAGKAVSTLDGLLAPVAGGLQTVFDGLALGKITAGEARVAFAALREQLSGNDSAEARNLLAVIDETSAGFDRLGAVSAQVTAALKATRQETDLPYTGLINNLQAMRTEPGAAVVEIDALIATLEKLNNVAARKDGTEKLLANINKFGSYAKNAIPGITAAMVGLGGAADEVAGQWGEALGSMVDDVVNFATAIAKGDYVGAAIQALTSIFTFFANQAKAAREEMKKTSDYNKQFKFDSGGYGTRTVSSYTTGFLFWTKTHYTEQVDEAARGLALSFENAVVQGLSGGFAEAVQTGDSSILEKAITSKLKEAALQGLLDAFLQSAAVAKLFGPLVGNLVAAFKTGNRETINQAVRDFRDGVKGMRGELDSLVEAGQIINEELGGAGEAVADGFKGSIQAAVGAVLGGGSPLQALYDGIRSRIQDAVINGFLVQRALAKLQPFLDALDDKLQAGMDPTAAIATLAAQLPALAAQLQLEFGPLSTALNTYLPQALNNNTAALNGNTRALSEATFEATTIVTYANTAGDSGVRDRLAGL